MEDNFFRELEASEVEAFKKWARDNFKPGMEVNDLWHPVVRKEIRRLQEAKAITCELDEEA